MIYDDERASKKSPCKTWRMKGSRVRRPCGDAALWRDHRAWDFRHRRWGAMASVWQGVEVMALGWRGVEVKEWEKEPESWAATKSSRPH